MNDDNFNWRHTWPNGDSMMCCKRCGALVYFGDRDTHLDWHANASTPLPVASSPVGGEQHG